MPVFIALLRGINVGGHNLLKMETLRTLCGSCAFEGVQTYIQSGNVVFRSKEKDPQAIGERLRRTIEKSAGFAPDVIVRTLAEWESVISRNPFAAREIPPDRLLVTFFDGEPDAASVAKVNAMKLPPEEFVVMAREMYVYFPEGMGRSKFPAVSIGKTLKVSGTVRNWNSVLKLLDMAVKS